MEETQLAVSLWVSMRYLSVASNNHEFQLGNHPNSYALVRGRRDCS